jgi:hypothetical protein
MAPFRDPEFAAEQSTPEAAPEPVDGMQRIIAGLFTLVCHGLQSSRRP